jgi:hypothetical protein
MVCRMCTRIWSGAFQARTSRVSDQGCHASLLPPCPQVCLRTTALVTGLVLPFPYRPPSISDSPVLNTPRPTSVSAMASSAIVQLFTAGTGSPSAKVAWYYKDPAARIQGPFSPLQMIQWCQAQRLPDTLPICGITYSTQQAPSISNIPANHLQPLSSLLQLTASGVAYNPLSLVSNSSPAPQQQMATPAPLMQQQPPVQQQQAQQQQQPAAAMQLGAVPMVAGAAARGAPPAAMAMAQPQPMRVSGAMAGAPVMQQRLAVPLPANAAPGQQLLGAAAPASSTLGFAQPLNPAQARLAAVPVQAPQQRPQQGMLPGAAITLQQQQQPPPGAAMAVQLPGGGPRASFPPPLPLHPQQQQQQQQGGASALLQQHLQRGAAMVRTATGIPPPRPPPGPGPPVPQPPSSSASSTPRSTSGPVTASPRVGPAVQPPSPNLQGASSPAAAAAAAGVAPALVRPPSAAPAAVPVPVDDPDAVVDLLLEELLTDVAVAAGEQAPPPPASMAASAAAPAEGAAGAQAAPAAAPGEASRASDIGTLSPETMAQLSALLQGDLAAPALLAKLTGVMQVQPPASGAPAAAAAAAATAAGTYGGYGACAWVVPAPSCGCGAWRRGPALGSRRACSPWGRPAACWRAAPGSCSPPDQTAWGFCRQCAGVA